MPAAHGHWRQIGGGWWIRRALTEIRTCLLVNARWSGLRPRKGAWFFARCGTHALTLHTRRGPSRHTPSAIRLGAVNIRPAGRGARFLMLGVPHEDSLLVFASTLGPRL